MGNEANDIARLNAEILEAIVAAKAAARESDRAADRLIFLAVELDSARRKLIKLAEEK